MPVRVVVTGGAGFLGTMLARRLLREPVALGGADPAPVDELILVDLVEPAADVLADPRVRPVTGPLDTALGSPELGSQELGGQELGDPEREGPAGVDAVFHLAGVVSGAAEADFDLGMATNVDGVRAVLEYARHRPAPPLVVFTSSLAVFGSDPALGPLGDVDDDTLPRPQSSYGIQKFVGEQLVADYTRKGFVRGRSVRLMTVSVRPGRPNAAASGFLSGIVREPLAGQRARCPVDPDTPVALSSPRRTLEGIVAAAAVDDATWGSRTALTLPALTTTPREMAEALDRVAGAGVSGLIDWDPDPVVGAIVGTWPARFRTPRAERLGLRAPASFDDVVQEYLADHPDAGG